MKTEDIKVYRATKVTFDDETFDFMDLVNIENKEDTIMAADEQFEEGELIDSTQIEIRDCQYVYEGGMDVGPFAFRRGAENED